MPPLDDTSANLKSDRASVRSRPADCISEVDAAPSLSIHRHPSGGLLADCDRNVQQAAATNDAELDGLSDGFGVKKPVQA